MIGFFFYYYTLLPFSLSSFRCLWETEPYLFILLLFFIPALAMVIHWSFGVSKFPRVSKTLLCILADLNNAVVWVIPIRLPISYSFSPLSKHSSYNQYDPYCHVPQLSYFSSKVQVLVAFFVFFDFPLSGPPGGQNPLYNSFFFFFFLLLIITNYHEN